MPIHKMADPVWIRQSNNPFNKSNKQTKTNFNLIDIQLLDWSGTTGASSALGLRIVPTGGSEPPSAHLFYGQPD